MKAPLGVDLVCLGEALIDLVADEAGASLADARRFVRAAGGAPANVAVGASRLGVNTGFVGKVGADPFGDHLQAVLMGAGVDTSCLRRDHEHRTGLAFVSLLRGGEREFLFYRHPSADQHLNTLELNDDYLTAARLLHFGTLTLAGGPVREATLHAMNVSGAAGVLRSIDVNLRLDAWPSPAVARREVLAAIKGAEVVKVSEDELAFLAGGIDHAAADKLRHATLRLLVVTRGAAGASYYLGSGARGDVPGFAVEAIDTTGAGDAFVAGLLAGILAEPEALSEPAALRHVVLRANACGALATTQFGAIPALPTGATVDAFLSVRGR